MSAFDRGLSTTVGTKFLVAATGAFLALFVLGHMLGNLQIFLGPEAMNSYAAALKGMPGPLWGVRLVLLAAFVVHIVGNVKLTRRNRAARPEGYAVNKPIESTLASRTMLLSGLVLLAFVAFHLAHLTLGLTHPEYSGLYDSQGRHDVYSMAVLGFQQPLTAGVYLAAMALLGMHLAHGAASMFQTGGLRPLNLARGVEAFGRLFALVVVAGNVSIVLACLLGLIEPAQGVF